MNHLNESQLNEYLDQMLYENSRQQIQAHLETCEQCRKELAELEILFATLDELPDMPLTRDLTPGVLAHLPKSLKAPNLWRQPAFLIQALFTWVLIGISIPMLQTLIERLPPFENTLTMPTFTLPTLAEIVAEFTLLTTWRPRFVLTLTELTFVVPQMPSLPHLPVCFDPSIMFTLVAVATILWGVGNFSLLRNKSEVHG